MKKQLFFGALACLALVSCSNDKTLDVNRIEDEIRYSVVTNGATKAADVYCNNNKPTEFNVWAIHNDATYINGDVIKYESSTWNNTSGNRYWPETGTLDFYAHVNAGDKFTWTVSDAAPAKITDYEVSTTVSEQKDLLYAVKTGVSKGSRTSTSNDPVTLNFRHALSQIVFNAKNTNTSFYVEVSGVTVYNVDNKGTYTYPTVSTETNNEEHTGAGSITSGTQGTWALSGTHTTDYAVEFTTAVPVAGNSTVVDLTSVNDTGKEFNSNALLLMPQSATTAWVPATDASNTANGSYIGIKCVVYNVANPTAGVQKGTDAIIWGGGTSAAPTAKELAIPVSFSWEQGKKYTYTLVFGEGGGTVTPPGPDTPTPVLVPIKFDVTIDDFVNATGTDINASL